MPLRTLRAVLLLLAFMGLSLFGSLSPAGPTPALGQAATPEESAEPTEEAPEGSRLGPEKEAVAQKIFGELISPCCWTTTVAQHGSGKAPVIQAEVRRMLASGMEEPAILQHYVQEYGERILAKPKKTGFNLAAYWVPYLAILAGAGVILAIVRRGMAGARRPSPAVAQPPATSGSRAGSDEEYRRRIDEELRRSL